MSTTSPTPINNKPTILKYPEDLSKNRFISLEFFTPANDDNIIGLIESMRKAGIVLFDSIDSQRSTSGIDVLNSFSTIKDKASSIITTGTKNFLSKGPRSSLSKKIFKGVLFLPLPNGLNDVSQNNYEKSSGAISSLVDKINNSSAASVINELTNSIGARNVVLNSDMNQVYKGSNLRSITLSWTLMPQNKAERNAIISMIKMIRKYSSPDASVSRNLLLAPAFVNVILSNPILNDIQRYHNMVISGVSIEFGSGGNMEMFYDGMIKEISLSISLSELKINTMQDWNDNLTHTNDKVQTETYSDQAVTTQDKMRTMTW